LPYDEEIPPLGDRVPVPDEINSLAHRVIGCAIEVHRRLGPRLPEIGYERALAIELERHSIHYVRQHRIQIEYFGQTVCVVRLDFLIESQLVVEVKSVEHLTPADTRQVLQYLEAMQLPLGLLINFNVIMLKEGVRRVIRSERFD
jgi:GxxExxY protein